MADVNRFLDSDNPSVERWLQIVKDESDLEAVIVLVQLIMDNLKYPCMNKCVNSFCLPGQIGDNFNFARFVETHIREKDYDMQLLVSNGEWLAEFFKKIVEKVKSDNMSWMLQLCEVFRVLILDDRTKFFIEYPLIAWYMKLLNIPLAHHNEESIRFLKKVCSHLTETIVEHVNAFSVYKRIFIRFVENIHVHMIRNFSEESVRIFQNILKYPDKELISKTMKSILRITANNEYMTNLFTGPDFVTALNKILLQDFPADTQTAALLLATQIQKKKPLQKLFSTRVFQNYLVESNHKLRKSCADLFKATFEVPLQPESISLLEKLVLFFAKIETNDATVECFIDSFSGEFKDWDKIYRVTLAHSENKNFLIDLWDYLVNGTLKYIRKREPNEAEYRLISFMHKGIDFLDQCDIIEHKFIYGLIFSLIATQDKKLQLLDLAHRQKLADQLVAIPLNQPFNVYKHEISAKNLMKALMIQKLIDQNAGAIQVEHLLNENIFAEAVQSLADPNFDFEHNPILCNKFMCLATMAETEILQGQAGNVAVMSYNLLLHLKGLERNLDFWSYIIVACIKSCAYIISKCTRRIDGKIDLNKLFDFLSGILSLCKGQVNFFTYTVFRSLCQMEFLKLYTIRPQNLEDFVAFMFDAIDTFIVKKEEPDFPFDYLDSMIRNLIHVLLMAPQELNVHDLVVKLFQTFPDEGYVYLFIEVLARRLQHETFVKSVIVIFLTLPSAKEYKKFAEQVNEIIERVPVPRRKELRTKFNCAFVQTFGFQNIEHLPQAKKAKATQMAKVVAEIMIKPYF